MQSLWQRLNKVAQGAVMMTETEVSSQLLGGCYNMLPNKVLNRVLDANLRAFAETISFDEREQAVAVELQQNLPPAQVAVALARIVRLSESERPALIPGHPSWDRATWGTWRTSCPHPCCGAVHGR